MKYGLATIGLAVSWGTAECIGHLYHLVRGQVHFILLSLQTQERFLQIEHSLSGVFILSLSYYLGMPFLFPANTLIHPLV